MKPLQLHTSDTWWGCGAAALTVLLGKQPSYWRKRILRYRKSHKPPRSSISYRACELNDPNNRDFTYDNEMRAILSVELGIVPRFQHLTKRCRFKNLKLETGTYLVMLNNHFCVLQQPETGTISSEADCFDGLDFCVPQSRFRYKNDMVESYCKLPDYEFYREKYTLTDSMQEKMEDILTRDRPFHPRQGRGRWFIVFRSISN